jgi:transposase
VNAWQPSIIEGLITAISNGRTEGYNRIVKHVGRIAFGFRSTENHKRRIRFACTRASRRAPTRAPKPC